jgi:hypothetical protein
MVLCMQTLPCGFCSLLGRLCGRAFRPVRGRLGCALLGRELRGRVRKRHVGGRRGRRRRLWKAERASCGGATCLWLLLQLLSMNG